MESGAVLSSPFEFSWLTAGGSLYLFSSLGFSSTDIVFRVVSESSNDVTAPGYQEREVHHRNNKGDEGFTCRSSVAVFYTGMIETLVQQTQKQKIWREKLKSSLNSTSPLHSWPLTRWSRCECWTLVAWNHRTDPHSWSQEGGGLYIYIYIFWVCWL